MENVKPHRVEDELLFLAAQCRAQAQEPNRARDRRFVDLLCDMLHRIGGPASHGFIAIFVAETRMPGADVPLALTRIATALETVAARKPEQRRDA